MHEMIDGQHGNGLFAVFAGEPHWNAADVYVASNVTACQPTPLTPAQAREMAAALLRAADEAEAVHPVK